MKKTPPPADRANTIIVEASVSAVGGLPGSEVSTKFVVVVVLL